MKPADILAMLTPNARFILSRFKEGAGAMSLAEMAIVIDPKLSGVPWKPGTPAWESGSTGNYRQDTPVPWRRKDRRFGPRKPLDGPLEKRTDGFGNAVPGLEEREDWQAAYVLTRAAITELDALGLLVPITTTGDTPAKWTTTARGERVMRLTRVSEWRREVGKSRA